MVRPPTGLETVSLPNLLEQPREAPAAAREQSQHDELLHRMGPAVAVHPQALVDFEPALAGDELPVPSVGQREGGAAASFRHRDLDGRAEMKANGVRHL